MNSFFNPTIADITQIVRTMDSLYALSMVFAVPLIGIVFVIELLHQNLKDIADASDYPGLLVRALITFMGLILYKSVFQAFVKVGFMMELAILPWQEWKEFLDVMGFYYQTNSPNLLTSAIPIVLAWTASFLALVLQYFFYWSRYAMLCILYFAGPIVVVLHLYEPASHLLGGWIRNVIQLCLWTVVMKLLVKILLTLQVQNLMATANNAQDVGTIVGISFTFLLLIASTPKITAGIMSGHVDSGTSSSALSKSLSLGAMLKSRIPGLKRL